MLRAKTYLRSEKVGANGGDRYFADRHASMRGNENKEELLLRLHDITKLESYIFVNYTEYM